jgi:hypothetical protein
MQFWLTLFFSNREYHKRACAEVFVVSVVSIFPLFLLPFIASMKSGPDVPFDLANTIWAAISAGQLFLYSFAMLGMIIWLSVEDLTNKAFPPRKYFIVAAFLTGCLCLLAYESDPSLSKPLNPFVVRVSMWIYFGYLLMYYMLLVFKMLRAPPLSEAVEMEVDSLIDESRRHKGPHHD